MNLAAIAPYQSPVFKPTGTPSTPSLETRVVSSEGAKPFLKWAGGKTKLAPQIMSHFPESFGRYHEPFVGGGAIFFKLRPDKATLSDVNPELVATWTAIRDNVDGVIALLEEHRVSEEEFYRVRSLDGSAMGEADAAARTIFLNKTCFNGLYRVNQKGKFNVPFGKYRNPNIVNEENLRRVSALLQGVKITVADATQVGRRARRGDLIYFDPPYDPISKSASFTSYAKGGFGKEEQAKLAKTFRTLANRGVHVVLSNSDTPYIRELYKDFKMDQIWVRRPINSRADRRGPVAEVIVSVG
ncbi:DNA adenine methylase [Myxococcota bacterium]|nr:DNA adenine methylase [Myxococcota bacterium]